MQYNGYAGRILEVDLTRGIAEAKPLDLDAAAKYVGGKGLGAHILWNRLPAGCDPLSEQNILVFATGPLTGTMAPTSGRMELCTKSPATGLWLDCNAGGSMGPELKYAGFDAVVVSGKSDKPVILRIEDGEAVLEPAGELWGQGAIEAHKSLKTLFSKEHCVACIGPAGETLAPMANVLTEYRSFGRGGAGAVMGSKNLKALVVRGRGALSIADPEEFDRTLRESFNELGAHPETGSARPEFGTNILLSVMDHTGVHPVQNYTKPSPEADPIDEFKLKGFFERSRSCMSCPIRCSKISRVKEGTFKGSFVEGPEYETVWAFGANCGNHDVEPIIEAERLCDEYGIDSVSSGNVIGFLIECFERGMIGPEDTAGIKLSWGDADAVIKALHLMGRREGPGELWSQGVKRVAETIPGSKDFAIHVKGLELPAYDPRASKGMALAYAVSDRGGCHLRSWPVADEIMNPATFMGLQTTEHKAELVKSQHDMNCLVNCSGLCMFATFAMSLEQLTPLFHAATGIEAFGSAEALLEAGERVNNLTRLFNLREGLTPDMDTLPGRFAKEPLNGGPHKGVVVDVKPLVQDYYMARDWDEAGVPTPGLLHRLGLENL